MKIRSSENSHIFQQRLFERFPAYSLQGLLMNGSHDFTAAVEAAEYEDGDDKTKMPMKTEEIYAKYVLAREVGIPLYVLCYMDGIYKIIEVCEENGSIRPRLAECLEEDGFVQWWAGRKQTVQVKMLHNGGEERLGETVFDRILRKHGYEWGGNIDGFVLTEDKRHVRFVIDNISVSRPNLADEPSHYFHSKNPKHGPRYEGWYAAVRLAVHLQVPHALFTIDKRDEYAEHIGFTIIERLTPDGIFYADGLTPDCNIISGMEHIIRTVNDKISVSSPPTLTEQENRDIWKRC